MSPSPFRVKALYEYSSPHEDDLSFPSGVVITVTDEEDADWYEGEYVDEAGAKHQGIFPRNFVEKIEPQAPPRPTRARTKREVDPAPAPAPPNEPEPEPEPERSPDSDVGHEVEESEDRLQKENVLSPKQKSPEARAPPSGVSPTSPKAAADPTPTSAPAADPEHAPSKQSEPVDATSPPSTKPASASQSKPAGPPPVSSKPSSNAFRDRIAAFNKPAAAPVTPFKPSGPGTGFIKKPFVAPPPSRNAYVPPPQQAPQSKLYRRDEDPEVREQEVEAQENAERAGMSSLAAPSEEGEGEDQPKPTSLKERIALLQKQQLEQAQRHAEASGKKKEAKRPPKKRTDSHEPLEGGEPHGVPYPVPDADPDTDEPERKASLDAERLPLPPRRKSSKGPSTEPHDGNEADMSGAGDTTEGPEDLTEREEIEDRPRRMSRVPTTGPSEPRKSIDRVESRLEPERSNVQEEDNEGGRGGEEEDDDEDEGEAEADDDDEEAAEYRRKEELRARMMKMSGGMGMGHMFGAPPPPPVATQRKKKTDPKRVSIDESLEEPTSPMGSAPPVPVPGMGMMALPGMGAPKRTEEPEEIGAPVAVKSPTSPRAPPPPPNRPADAGDDSDEGETAPAPPPRTSTDRAAPPPVPGGRPAPPPVPSDSRPVPPPPAADAPESAGSESDEDTPGDVLEGSRASESRARSPPPLPPVSARALPPAPKGEDAPQSPTDSAPSKRNSRLPPPIPGMAPALPPAATGQGRPPPPPPPGGPLSRQSTLDFSVPPLPPSRPPMAGDNEEEEVTEYEGDYDTDIASSAPRKDALKSHARDSSLEDSSSLKSPVTDAPPSLPPPIPGTSGPRVVPPPLPSQAPQSPPVDTRRSIDMPRAAPPPPPPGRETSSLRDDEYDPFNYSAPAPQVGGFSQSTPIIEEEPRFPGTQPIPSPPPQNRPPPPAPPGRAPTRQSLDIARSSTTIRRSMDAHRPSVESGFIANDIDLAAHNGWWRQPNQVPPVLQGRRDVYFESEESTSTQGSNTIVTRTIYILFQDYSQTILTVVFDPYDQSDVELDQRHEPPPRQLRQDELEQAYERFGRAISSAVAAKKDSVVADGTPQGLVHELLRPFKNALAPVGTRAYGALVYANLANASTQQNDEIRPGDVVSIRNGKFQGKHGAMHAKYTAEVGKPDHVGIVAEWDGTKKKVRAWEQGRENKKVKMESFKLDDLRSGEVKIWRVMPRSWVGWNDQP